MTLDEAIKHAEEVAERERKNAQVYDKVKNNNLHHPDRITCEQAAERCKECAEEQRQLAEWLKELKQLREQTRWIPVSEKLPKVADCYTVTRKIGSDLIVDACFFDGIGNWYNGNQINRERNCLTNIVAWMPRPEPYQPESEVQDADSD